MRFKLQTFSSSNIGYILIDGGYFCYSVDRDIAQYLNLTLEEYQTILINNGGMIPEKNRRCIL